MGWLRSQQVTISRLPSPPPAQSRGSPTLSRAQRAHRRLGWAERLSRKGPAFAVRVDLVESRDTASGYVWSSSGGPPFRIAPGTTVSASITIRHDRPIELIIPALGKLLGG